MYNKEFLQYLKDKYACQSAIDWVGDKDLKTVWEECDRGDWMMWLVGTAKYDLKIVTGIKVKQARLVQHLMKDQRILDALDVADKFSKGEATREELDDAYADAAYASAYASASAYAYAYDDAADAYASASAAYASASAAAAADAAYAYDASAYAYADASAYAYAAYAADAADAASTRKETLKKCADIVREEIKMIKL